MFSRGTSSSCGRLPSSREAYTVTSRYNVEGNRICHVITSVNAGALLTVGETICADVLAIDARSQRFKLDGDDEETTIYRILQSQVRCPGSVDA